MCPSCSFSPASLLNCGALAGRLSNTKKYWPALASPEAGDCAKTKFATASRLSKTRRQRATCLLYETLFISPISFAAYLTSETRRPVELDVDFEDFADWDTPASRIPTERILVEQRFPALQ